MQALLQVHWEAATQKHGDAPTRETRSLLHADQPLNTDGGALDYTGSTGKNETRT